MPNRTRAKTEKQILHEIYAELRSIIRRQESLSRPISTFQPINGLTLGRPPYRVVFDDTPPREITGLQIMSRVLALPDERIHDEVISFAQSVWHLKDRLKQYVIACKLPINVEDLANQNISLLVCADLANEKKHGKADNRSKLSPQLSEVYFDTRNSGLLEFFYDGSLKQKELRVTNVNSIPYTIKILEMPCNKNPHNTGNIIADNAVDYIWNAFKYWFPTIDKLNLLKKDNPESSSLLKILVP